MANSDLLRVTNLRVEKLFGMYTHEVELRTKDRVTIIHGPNGVGKTVLLRLVAAVLSGNFTEVVKVPFRVFEVVLSDGSALGFERNTSAIREASDKEFIGACYLKRPGQESAKLELKASQVDLRRWAIRIERETPWLARFGEDRFVDRRTEEVLTSVEVLSRYSEYLPGKPRRKGFFSEPEWMSDIKGKVGVHLIEAQRLLRISQPPRRDTEYWHAGFPSITYMATVNIIAKELQGRISETLTSYAKESQALDQSFPQRLLQSAVRTLSADELKERMKNLEDKRQQLKRIGLIEEDPTYPFDVSTLEKLDETRRTVMTLYVEDTGRKLGVLDELARRVEFLLGNINKKFEHKAILIDRQKGLIARTSEQQFLDLAALSSGEQHELVLLYDLLFRVRPNTLVLIDEPELSLHVAWQKSILPDLLALVATGAYDVVLATHSPFIVGERPDLMVPLSVDGGEPASRAGS